MRWSRSRNLELRPRPHTVHKKSLLPGVADRRPDSSLFLTHSDQVLRDDVVHADHVTASRAVLREALSANVALEVAQTGRLLGVDWQYDVMLAQHVPLESVLGGVAAFAQIAREAACVFRGSLFLPRMRPPFHRTFNLRNRVLFHLKRDGFI